MPSSQVQQRAECAIETYLATHSHTLTPVPGNLQPSSDAPAGEIIFPLILRTPSFNPMSTHWDAGNTLLYELRHVIGACDALFQAMGGDVQHSYYQNINRTLRDSARFPERLDIHDGALHTLKLVINVAENNAPLRCGHESPYCVISFLGTAEAVVVITGVRFRSEGSGMVLKSLVRISTEVFEGSRYELQFFLPPAPAYTGPMGGLGKLDVESGGRTRDGFRVIDVDVASEEGQGGKREPA